MIRAEFPVGLLWGSFCKHTSSKKNDVTVKYSCFQRANEQHVDYSGKTVKVEAGADVEIEA